MVGISRVRKLFLALLLAVSGVVIPATPALAACVGTQLVPADGPNLRTIVANAPAGTTFCFAAGTYNHTGGFMAPKDNMKFIGAGRGVTFITGWDTLTGFTLVNGLYQKTVTNILPDVASRTYNSGHCWAGGTGLPAMPGCALVDDIYNNGVPLKRAVEPCTTANVLDGYFCTDYDNPAVGRDGIIYLNPPGTGGPGTIKFLRRSSAFQFSCSPTCASGVEIRDMTIQGFRNYGIITNTRAGGVAPVLNNIEVSYIHGAAIGFGDKDTPGAKLTNSVVKYAGQDALSGSGDNILVDHDDVSFGGYAGYASGFDSGMKFVYTDDAVVSNNTFHDMYGPAIWFDVYNERANIFGNTVSNGHRDYGFASGIFYELSCNGSITGNTITNIAGNPISMRLSDDTVIGTQASPNTFTAIHTFDKGINLSATNAVTNDPSTTGNCDDLTLTGNRVQYNRGTFSNASATIGVDATGGGNPTNNLFIGNTYTSTNQATFCTQMKWWWVVGGVRSQKTFAQWQALGQDTAAQGGSCTDP